MVSSDVAFGFLSEHVHERKRERRGEGGGGWGWGCIMSVLFYKLFLCI